jgi:hypothetical protein
LHKGAQLAALRRDGRGPPDRGVCRAGEQRKAQKDSGNRAAAAVDRPPFISHKTASSGRFAFKPPLTMQMLESSALPGKSVIIV